MNQIEYNKILEKAKQTYQEAIKSRDYQDELYSQCKFESHRMSIDDLVWRRHQYQTEITLLENIFGKDLNQLCELK